VSFVGLNERFRREWKASGYPLGNGSAAVVPPPRKGFKRLYYLTEPDHALSNIVFGRLKISRFSELNDPFELLGANFGNKALRHVVRAHKDDFDKEHGLICFSEDWIDPVLWSHYADKHRGVALGFDVDEVIAKPVSYKSVRLKEKLPVGATTITPSLADILTYIKFESWKYEREWRVLTELKNTEREGSLYFMPHNKMMKLACMQFASQEAKRYR
jgi:hypothetical protein